VIPWRRREGRLEILVVGSSKCKHWVVPKGIQEPGLTPQASAAKEALEEAGVEGVVASQPIGRYEYEKWGAVCSVAVYPMEVTGSIPDAQWPERHRRRRWLSPQEAVVLLREPALGPMIRALAAAYSPEF
jgi:phosphohistidine phosphatase